MSSSSSSKTSPPPTRRCPPCCNKRARMRRVPVQATLEDFFKALRGSDLEIHLNAQVEAARAVELVGWSDRALLKIALGTTLAKTTVDRALFDEAFDHFFRFSSFENLAAPGSGGPGGCQGSGGQALSQLLLSGDSAALAKRMQEAAREVGLTDIWFFTQKGFYTQKIQQAMGLELLDREISDAKRQTLAPE